ncbi:MAG: hypothetical protein IT489_08030 [Gammaproteobacteria bacterium]|nr:hypothetical protein [Gammaproteobacteria bacterium]
MKQIYLKETTVILVGSALVFCGDFLLGVRVEYFRGMATFTPYWILDIFLVPFIAGYVVAKLYGEKNGKWLACAPPLIVRGGSVLQLYIADPEWHADLFFHLHLHYWALCVILAVEAANIGGILGEFKLSAYIRNDEKMHRKDQTGPSRA